MSIKNEKGRRRENNRKRKRTNTLWMQKIGKRFQMSLFSFRFPLFTFRLPRDAGRVELWKDGIFGRSVYLCRHCRQEGFTLFEILLSTVILGVAIVPIMQAMPQALSTGAMVERMTKVTFLAEKKMEETKNFAIYDFETDYSVAVAAFTTPDENFKYTVMDDADSDIKSLAVIVWYDEDSDNILDAGESNIRFDTKVAKR